MATERISSGKTVCVRCGKKVRKGWGYVYSPTTKAHYHLFGQCPDERSKHVS